MIIRLGFPSTMIGSVLPVEPWSSTPLAKAFAKMKYSVLSNIEVTDRVTLKKWNVTCHSSVVATFDLVFVRQVTNNTRYWWYNGNKETVSPPALSKPRANQHLMPPSVQWFVSRAKQHLMPPSFQWLCLCSLFLFFEDNIYFFVSYRTKIETA